MKIEKEMRFYLPSSHFETIKDAANSNLAYSHSFYERTVLYENPNPEYTFYSKAIDGRLRLRYQESVENLFESGAKQDGRYLVTWKRRLPDSLEGSIRNEEEIEYGGEIGSVENVKKIFEDVLKCPRISSYERRRHFFGAKEVELTIDEFPFGLMVEFELKGNDEKYIYEAAQSLGFDPSGASKLSCDDKYSELCEQQGKTIFADIKFDNVENPEIK